MVSSNTKGDRAERGLVNYLDENGWAVLRAPSSGSATERELPDILAGNGEKVVAIELKRTSDTTAYFDQEKVEGLVYFAEQYNAAPMLAAQFDCEHGDPAYGEEWPAVYLADVWRTETTDAGTHKLTKTEALEAACPVHDL